MSQEEMTVFSQLAKFLVVFVVFVVLSFFFLIIFDQQHGLVLLWLVIGLNDDLWRYYINTQHFVRIRGGRGGGFIEFALVVLGTCFFFWWCGDVIFLFLFDFLFFYFVFQKKIKNKKFVPILTKSGVVLN